MNEVERHRDRQQWMLDLAVKLTGREQNFEYDSRPLPPEVKSYAQIPASMARLGQDCERMAREADGRGHAVTALELYFKASQYYRYGQHTIFEDDNPNKIYLYERMAACYERVIALSPYEIRRVTIPCGAESYEALMHLAPGGGRRCAVLLVPGMDMTKESYPSPLSNFFAMRGMHVLVLDGPGQGISNLRKQRVTMDNYDRAGVAAIDALREMDNVDPENIFLVGLSMGSYWGLRIAAKDARLAGVATAAACYGDRTSLFETASPRFKQVFMYMAGMHDEEEFDETFEDFSLREVAPKITARTLLTVGEYDPLTPLPVALDVYEHLRCPKELWVLEDDFHSSHRDAGIRNLAGGSVVPAMLDWLSDICNGVAKPSADRRVLVRRSGGLGVYGPEVEDFTLRSRFAS